MNRAWWLDYGPYGPDEVRAGLGTNSTWVARNQYTDATVEGKPNNFQDPVWLQKKGLPNYIGRVAQTYHYPKNRGLLTPRETA